MDDLSDITVTYVTYAFDQSLYLQVAGWQVGKSKLPRIPKALRSVDY